VAEGRGVLLSRAVENSRHTQPQRALAITSRANRKAITMALRMGNGNAIVEDENGNMIARAEWPNMDEKAFIVHAECGHREEVRTKYASSRVYMIQRGPAPDVKAHLEGDFGCSTCTNPHYKTVAFRLFKDRHRQQNADGMMSFGPTRTETISLELVSRSTFLPWINPEAYEASDLAIQEGEGWRLLPRDPGEFDQEFARLRYRIELAETGYGAAKWGLRNINKEEDPRWWANNCLEGEASYRAGSLMRESFEVLREHTSSPVLVSSLKGLDKLDARLRIQEEGVWNTLVEIHNQAGKASFAFAEEVLVGQGLEREHYRAVIARRIELRDAADAAEDAKYPL